MALKPLAKIQRISKVVIPVMIAIIQTHFQVQYLITVRSLVAVPHVTMAQLQRAKMQHISQLIQSVKIAINLMAGPLLLRLITLMY